MSVICEGISVIVRCADLEAKYPGGALGFKLDCPRNSFCSDGYLARVEFAAAADAGAFIERLMEHGLIYVTNDEYVEIAVVDEHLGLVRYCDWLHTVEIPTGRVACMIGGPVSPVIAPHGWVPVRWRPCGLDFSRPLPRGFDN